MFETKFATANAAFDQNDKGVTETIRILKQIITSLERGQNYGATIDYNGNKVGEWEYEYEGITELPNEVTYDINEFKSIYDDNLYEEIGDRLCDDYGCCVRGYSVDPIYTTINNKEVLIKYLVSDIDWDV